MTERNPLREFFDNHQGPVVWKWLHYFEMYHRHLAKFIGKPVTVVEVGVYGGGSLAMWHHYFGAECRVHGVDIQPDCKAHEGERTTIHIGDQADRKFWRRFREAVPHVDILIDDGGHQPQQQTVTLEEMLPAVAAGGVYICEDIHEVKNPFAAFVLSLADKLNAFQELPNPGLLSSGVSEFQAAVHSVHLYPYAVVIEKRGEALEMFAAPKHGK